MTAKWIGAGLGIVAVYVAGCTKQVDSKRSDVAVSMQALTTAPDAECTWASRAGHEYWLCRDVRSWRGARDQCRDVDLELVTIDSAEENAFLRESLTEDSWIGANDRGAETSWQWVADGTPFWQGGASGAPVEYGTRYSRFAGGG